MAGLTPAPVWGVVMTKREGEAGHEAVGGKRCGDGVSCCDERGDGAGHQLHHCAMGMRPQHSGLGRRGGRGIVRQRRRRTPRTLAEPRWHPFHQIDSGQVYVEAPSSRQDQVCRPAQVCPLVESVPPLVELRRVCATRRRSRQWRSADRPHSRPPGARIRLGRRRGPGIGCPPGVGFLCVPMDAGGCRCAPIASIRCDATRLTSSTISVQRQ